MVFLQTCTEFYPSQKKILECVTNDDIRMFEALFKGVSTRFGLRNIEKSVENPDCIFCSSFQNLRLGGINSVHVCRNTIAPSVLKSVHASRAEERTSQS